MVAGLAFSAIASADEDLPGRVGRIADAAGAVSLAPEGRTDQWEPVGANQTIVGGDNLFVSPEGRAEIGCGGGQFRLAGGRWQSSLVVREGESYLHVWNGVQPVLSGQTA